jgi:predicted nucleic acid-binding protein
MIVIDASALIEILLQTSRSSRVAARLTRRPGAVSAPHLIDLEVAQVVRRYTRAGDITQERGREALEDLSTFPLTRYRHDLLIQRIWELRDNLTAYDAAYVVLAEALAAPLITCDGRLAAASGHRARVEVL